MGKKDNLKEKEKIQIVTLILQTHLFMKKIIVAVRLIVMLGGFGFTLPEPLPSSFVYHLTRILLQSILLVMHSCMCQNIIQMSLVMVVAMTFFAVFEGAW